jgi:hypothetical protein
MVAANRSKPSRICLSKRTSAAFGRAPLLAERLEIMETTVRMKKRREPKARPL